MNILGVANLGGFQRDFHGPNYWDAMEELGHTITRLDHNHPLPDGTWGMMFHFYHSIDRSMLDELHSRGVVTVLLIGDEPCEFIRTKHYTPLYNIVFNQTGGPDNISEHRKLGSNMYSLPHCANPNIYYPDDITEEERRIYGSDVAFIGSLRTPGVRNDRLWMGSSTNPLLNYDYKTWGPGTTNDRWIYPEEVRKIYNATKIIFNPSAVADQPDWDLEFPTLLGETACRVYNTAAGGAFQLIPYRPDATMQPFDDTEVGYYEHGNLNDLQNSLDYWLDPSMDELRADMAMRAYIKCVTEHTYVQRAKIVIDKVEEYIQCQ